MAQGFQPNAFQLDAFQNDGAAPVVVQVAPPLVFDRGAADLVIDPITRDFIDSDDGGFIESSDSRSAVLCQLDADYNAWWGDAQQGSRIRAILSGEEPGTITDVADEAQRALQLLVGEGLISDLTVVTDRDESGRGAVLLSYTDRASGGLVDLAYVPLGG